MTAGLKELSLEDRRGALAKQPLPFLMWGVLNEELRAKT